MVVSESEEVMPARQPATGGSSASKRLRHRAGVSGVTIVVISAMALLASACGSSSSSPSSSTSSTQAASPAASTTSSGSTAPWVTQAKADVTEGYGTGLVKPPPTSGPKAVKGKNVWYISCGESYSSCAAMSKDFKQASAALGWHTTLTDGKASPTVAAGLVRQAIAAKADGIVMVSYDCPGVKAALLAAQAAKIPVVSYLSFNCNSPAFPHSSNQPSLFVGPRILGATDPSGLSTLFGKLVAEYGIAAANGKMNELYVSCSAYVVCDTINKGYWNAIKPCTGCKVTNVLYTFAQVPNPAAQIWKSAILAHPDANVITYNPASIMPLGLQTAIKDAARPITVYGAEGGDLNYNNIRSGFEQDAVVRQDAQGTWATADTLNRIFAGGNPSTFPDEGGGVQVVDKSHNLPAAGQPYKSALDYQPLYEKVWNGQ
jgi:ribose transport system substrate-binding protein